MSPWFWLAMLILSAGLFYAFNELVYLPYQTPKSVQDAVAMSKRPGITNLAFMLIEFALICSGVESLYKIHSHSSKVAESYRDDGIKTKMEE